MEHQIVTYDPHSRLVRAVWNFHCPFLQLQAGSRNHLYQKHTCLPSILAAPAACTWSGQGRQYMQGKQSQHGRTGAIFKCTHGCHQRYLSTAALYERSISNNPEGLQQGLEVSVTLSLPSN